MTTYFIINYIYIWRLSGLVPRGLQGSEFGVCYKLEAFGSVTILNLRYYRQTYRFTDLQTYRLTEGCILQPKRYRTEFGKFDNDLFLMRFVDLKNILVNFNVNQETEEE